MSPFARDITLVLLVKAVALGLIWLAFFRTPAAPQMTMDRERVESRVLAHPSAAEAPDAVR